MKQIQFILLIVLILQTNILAQNDLTIKTYYVSADYLSGFILPHHKSFNYFIKGYVNSANITIAKQTNGEKNWHRLYNYPHVGVGYNFADFGNKKQLGNANAIYPFIVFHIFDKPKINSNIRLAAGVAWVSKHFDIQDNVYNIAIGSHLNAYLNFNINFDFKLNKNFKIFSGLGFAHFSNGGTHQPNKGINVVGLNAGLKYYINNNMQKPDDKDDLPKNIKKKNDFSIIASSGFKTLEPARLKKYFVSSLSVNAERQITHKSRLGLGIDFFNDNSKTEYLRIRKKVEANTKIAQKKDNYYAGGHLSYDLVFGKTSFTIQTGFYFWQRAKSFQPIYHRFGLKYRFSKHWMANLTLKTFWAAADFAEWGVGYIF